MPDSPKSKLATERIAGQNHREVEGHYHLRKADSILHSLHTPPALFPGTFGNSFKRPRTTSPPTSTEENGSETDAVTPSSESESISDRRVTDREGSPLAGPPTGPVHAHQHTPLRFSFGMSNSDQGNKAAVDGLMTENMLNLTDPIADSSMGTDLPSYGQAMDVQEEHTMVQPSEDKPDSNHQIEEVKVANEEALQEGQSWFLIDRRWFRLWSTVCSDMPKDKQDDDVQVGMVKTRGLLQIIDGHISLRQGLEEGIDFELLSSQAWRLLVTWYGLQDPPIERKVIKMPSTEMLRIELYPPRLFVTGIGEKTTAFQITLSALQTLGDLKMAAQEHLAADRQGSASDIDYEERFWRLPLDQSDKAVTAESLLAAGVELIPEDQNQSTTLAELQIDQPVERMAMEVRKKGSSWLFTSEGKPISTSLKGIFKQDGGDFLSRVQSGASSSDIGSSSTAGSSNAVRVTRSQTAAERGSEKQRGLTGLYNLGNTCFMNAALQCMSNTKELKDYFVSGVYKGEINTSNPLGMGGAMAKVFGELLCKLWNSGGGAWHPREFKTVLSRFSPQFVGYYQQDSQELLAFLLDGLHEDLNRIVKKPYIEAPDWEGGGTKEMVAFAHKQWEIYKLRNDSVIVDLFQGQYRSTLVCPDCGKVSIKFDPFMYLTLPIPNRKTYTRKVIYIPWKSEKSPIEVEMQFNGQTSIQTLKKNLGNWFHADWNHMIACDVFSRTFYRIYGDFENATEIGNTDVTFVYELPSKLKPIAPMSHASHSYHRRERLQDLEAKSKIKYDSRQGEEMALLPVFSLAKESRHLSHYYSKGGMSAFGQPFFVAIHKEHLNDEDVIQRAVMEKYVQYTKDSKELKRHIDETEEEARSSQDDWDMLHDTPSSVILPESSQVNEETVAEIHDGGETVHIVPDMPMQSQEAHSTKATSSSHKKNGKTKGPSVYFVVNRDDQSPLTLKPEGHEDYGEELHKRAARLATVHLEDTSNQMDTDQEDDMTHIEKSTETANSWPMVYTGGALVCVWPEKIKEKMFGDDDDAWTSGLCKDKFIDPELEAERKVETGGKKAKSTISIEDCLNEFTKEEQLGESDPWYCPQCKEFKQATKKFDLWKVPDILVVHLKRFSGGRMSRDKIDSFIDFPILGFDLTHRVEGAKAVAELHADEDDDEKLMQSIGSLGANDDAVESDAPLYDLYAVDNHYGGMGGGHYTAYAKNPEDEKWHYFDDSSVRSVGNPDEVKGSAAYLLFYRRRTTRPIGGKSREKVREKVNSVDEEATQGAYHSSQGQVNQSSERSEEEQRDSSPSRHHSIDQAKLNIWDLEDLGNGDVDDDAEERLIPPYEGPDDSQGWDAIMQGRSIQVMKSIGSITASLGDADDADSSFSNISGDADRYPSRNSAATAAAQALWEGGRSGSGEVGSSIRPIETL